MSHRCRACGAADPTAFFEVDRVPVHSNLLFGSAREALSQEQGTLSLAVCRACAFVQNSAHDPELAGYDQSYEDGQGHSPLFQSFATYLVESLVERWDLRGKRILEIGCGQGDFLVRLCEAGGNHGLGFDPTYHGPRTKAAGTGRAEFRSEHYGSAHADVPADFLFLRHTLEHIGEVDDFVSMLARNLVRGTPVYVEVPEAFRILQEFAFWDVYYEHPSYFTDVSLGLVLERNGFEIRSIETGYRDQYLMVQAVLRGDGNPDRRSGDSEREQARRRRVYDAALAFGERVAAQLDGWRARLGEWSRCRRRVVVWGAGSKAVGFLTALAGAGEVDAIVDINPKKQGAYQAGTGHAIVSPGELARLRPSVVIVMNPIYREEIGAELRRLGIDAEVLAL